MIVTVTPNTALDHTLRIKNFQLHSTIRAVETAWGMGGKAADASWILGKLGIPSRALGFAAGPTGRRMEDMLRERGVETDFVWVDGDTRMNTVITVTGEGHSTITSPSLHVSAEHLSAFHSRYEEALAGASCVVIGGSLPRGVPTEFYAEAIAQARDRHIPVIFDASGAALVAGVKSRPELIKLNVMELGDLLGQAPASRKEAQRAAAKLCDELGSHVIVTLGHEGAMAILGERSYFIHPVSVQVASAAGAGDGVLAGLALVYSRGEPLEVGLQHGFALAGAILQTLATADFLLEEYERLLPTIRITPLL